MADPSGPTVAEGPEELNPPSSSPPADAPEAPTDASPVTAGGAPDAERPPAVADETGTVAGTDAAGRDAETAAETTTVVPAGEAAGATSGWPADAPADLDPAVDGDKPPSAVTADVTDGDTADAAASAADDNGGSGSGSDIDSDGSDDGPDDEDDDAAKGGLLDKKIQLDAKTLLVVLAVMGLLAIAAGYYLLDQRQAKDAAAPKPAPTATTVFRLPTEYVPFEDKETGVTLSVPKDWRQRSTRNLGPAARLLLEVPNTQDTVLLRVNSYSQEVTPANLGDQKAVIDALFAAEKITILEVVPGDLGGMPTLAYVYNFTDPTGVVGIHAHYFIFQGRKAVQLIFQALPIDHYSSGGLGTVWSKISESIKITPGPPPDFLEQLGAAQTGTTVPGPATTAPPPSAPPSTG